MNKAFYILNGVLLLAVAVLFYLFFAQKTSNPIAASVQKIFQSDSTAINNAVCTIGFFDQDTLEARFKQFIQVKNELKDKEKSIQNTLNNYRNKIEARYKEIVAIGGNLSQSEQEAFQKELAEMQNNYAQKEQSLRNDLEMSYFKKAQALNEKVKKAAAEIALAKGYSYVLSKSSNPNNIIYYKDSIFDITTELVKKLNED